MADHCFVQDAPGRELFTILDMLGVALGMMAAISVEEKGPATHVVTAVVEHLRAWGRKKVIFRIDGEPAIRALGVAIQYAMSEETVIECRIKYSSPSVASVENMNKELCGLVRCFRIYLWERAKMEITTESLLLPWLVRHCGWILSRYAVRADVRTGYSRLKGREHTAGTPIFRGRFDTSCPRPLISRNALTAGALRSGWENWIEAMNTSSAWRLEQYLHDQFDGRSRASAGTKGR